MYESVVYFAQGVALISGAACFIINCYCLRRTFITRAFNSEIEEYVLRCHIDVLRLQNMVKEEAEKAEFYRREMVAKDPKK